MGFPRQEYWRGLPPFLKLKCVFVCVCACVQACACMLSHVRLFATPWTIALQRPLSMEFSRQESWSGLTCSPAGDLPDPGTKPMSPASPASPALQSGSLPRSHWESPNWSRIDLQCLVGFRCAAKWFSYTYIYTGTCVCILFRLWQGTECSFLCYTVGTWCFSILYIVSCIC